jgi:hypothetical protein
MLFVSDSGRGAARALSIEAVAREPIDRVEVVANGVVVQTLLPARTGDRALTRTIALAPLAAAHSWVAVRCFVEASDTIRLAHSSPVFLPGRFAARADAEFFVDWIDELIERTRSEPSRVPDEAERARLLDLYGQARDFYAARR